MKPYLAIFSARFRTMLQYRAAAFAEVWTQIFFGLVMIMVYEAFYRSTDRPQPMTFPQVVSYVWLGQALLALLPWNVDAEVKATVRRPWFRQFFTYAIPLACVNYFPVLAVLHRRDPLGSPTLFQWLAPLAGVGFLSPLYRCGSSECGTVAPLAVEQGNFSFTAGNRDNCKYCLA